MRTLAIHVPISVRALLAITAVAALGHAAPARATDFALGEIGAPVSLAIGNAGLLGPFSDAFSFSIGATDSFEFESFVSTGFSNRSAIPDMVAALYSGGALVANGLAETVVTPEGFPSRDITFASLALGPGDYRLVFSGTASPFDPGLPITSSYFGSVAFNAVTAIPEPSTYLLMLMSLGALALLAAIRREGRARARHRPGRH